MLQPVVTDSIYVVISSYEYNPVAIWLVDICTVLSDQNSF